MKRIKERIRLIDFGDYYKWELTKLHCRITTEGFCSMTDGLRILKENIEIKRKPS